jgi:putative sigma-54 modulation protein
MRILIQTPDFEAPGKLTNYVNESVLKLAAFGDRILEAQVLLKINKSDIKEDKICELKLVIPGSDLFVEKQSSTFEDAVLKCIEAVKHQISRWKDSVNNGKLRGSVTPLESEEASM